jgi:hypothetical protein
MESASSICATICNNHESLETWQKDSLAILSLTGLYMGLEYIYYKNNVWRRDWAQNGLWRYDLKNSNDRLYAWLSSGMYGIVAWAGAQLVIANSPPQSAFEYGAAYLMGICGVLIYDTAIHHHR